MIVTLEEDPETGDLVLPIPDELMKEMGWEIGDELIFEETEIWHEDYEGKGLILYKKT